MDTLKKNLELRKALAEVDRLTSENLELRLLNKRLKSDNVDLQLRNESLRAYCTSLEVQIDEYNDNPSTPLDL